MADREFTVERFSIRLQHEGSGKRRVTSVIVAFAAERLTWQITIARMSSEQLRVLFDQLRLSIFETDDQAIDLVVEKDLVIDLDPRAADTRPTRSP